MSLRLENQKPRCPDKTSQYSPAKSSVTAGGQESRGQSIFGLEFPNTAQAHMQAFDKTRMLADEATGIPSYAHGQSGVTGTTRTASRACLCSCLPLPLEYKDSGRELR